MASNLKNLNHEISLRQAIEMTSRYRKEKKSILREGVRADTLPFSETFSKSAFEALTAEPGCVGIRCYFCMDAENNVRVLFVGVNENNEDILPKDETKPTAMIAEVGQRCPPVCPRSGPLNDQA